MVLLALAACREEPDTVRVLAPIPYPRTEVDWGAGDGDACRVEPQPSLRIYGPSERGFADLLAVADRDGDGRDELVTPETSEDLAIYRGTDVGLDRDLETRPIGVVDTLASAGDLDGDGLEDLVIGGVPQLLVLFGQREGDAPREFVAAAGPAAAVLDDDGGAYVDLLVTGPAPGTISRFEGRSPGLLPLPDEQVTLDAVTLGAVGDVDGDGLRDAAAIDGLGDLWLLRGGRALGEAVAVPGGLLDVAAPPVGGDLDGDGHSDVVTARTGEDDAGVVEWWRGGPDGLADEPALVLAGSPDDELWRAVVLGDLDGDGDDELALGAPGDGSGVISVLAGGPDGPGAPRATIRAEGRQCRLGAALAAGDFDGDGVVELAARVGPDGRGGSDPGALVIVPAEAAWVR